MLHYHLCPFMLQVKNPSLSAMEELARNPPTVNLRTMGKSSVKMISLAAIL